MDKQSLRLSKDFNPTLNNNHDYLNFVKKNQRMMQYQRNKVLYPTPIEINRKNSVFAIHDTKRQYRGEKLTSSTNSPAYHLELKNNIKSNESISSQQVFEIVERKHKEIEEFMTKERQSMSEIIYNYTKFRSMESQYYKNEKNKKKSEKIPKKEDLLKFPQVTKQNQIFTIDYDPEGKKMIKINVESTDIAELKKKSQSLLNDNNASVKDYRELSLEKSGLTKKDKALFKRKKMESEFGIEIKSINNRLLQNFSDYENGLKLRRELYQLVSDPTIRAKLKMGQVKKQGDQLLAKQQKYAFQQKQSKKFLQGPFHFNSKEVFASSIIPKYKYKYSSTSLSNREYEDLEKCGQEEQAVKGDIQKQRQIQVLSKRQSIKKNFNVVYQKEITVYDHKMYAYRQFLFLLNMAHKRYDPIFLKEFSSLRSQDKYRFYLGPGNNALLVKSLMKRRFWWVLEQDYKKANFCWTQLKINNLYALQKKSQIKDIDSKIQTQTTDSPKKKKISKKQIQSKSPTKAALFKPPLPTDREKILTASDRKIYDHLQQQVSSQLTDKFVKFASRLKSSQVSTFTPTNQLKSNQKIHNHLQFNHFIGNKKALFYNLKKYYELLNKNVFQIIPLTFHIKDGAKDAEYTNFLKQYKRLENLKQIARKKKQKQQKSKKIRNVWIVKPGELSNRGNGIVVINEVYELNNIFKKKEKHSDGAEKTYIVQKYIQNPLLYKGRKFDIRHYMIITRLHGIMRAYWYGQGYIRTSSFDFDLDDVGDEMIHLTNDAIQKNSTFYGKHEEGNKLSYSEFQKYLDQKYQQDKISFAEHIYPKMKAIATDAVRATYLQLDSNNLEHNFQVFGLDFMIDQKFKVWLIEVNTNPCLEISSKLLGRIIPNMLQQAFRLSIDVIFPPPTHYPNSQKYLTPDNALGRLMYELIFDEARDGRELVQLYKNSTLIDYGQIMEDEEIYQNQGKEIQLSPDIN